MKDYKEKEKCYEIILENDKVVRVDKKWVEKTIQALDTDIEDVLLMYLEYNDFLENEELEELDKQAKENKPKTNAKSQVERKKVVRERKPNPTKENIIKVLENALKEVATDIKIENIGKIITFKVENKDFKLDLTEKRVKKDKN